MELCMDCNGGCCRQFNIIPSGRDILRIAKTLNVEIGYFITLIPASINDKDAKEFPVFRFKDTGDNNYFRLVLKQDTSQIDPEETKCIFLIEMIDYANFAEMSDVKSRCGIYAIRPTICRTFPTKYDEKKGRLMIKDQYLKTQAENKNKVEPNKQLCPKPLDKKDYENNSDEYFENCVVFNAEQKFFKKIAENWNKNPGKSDELYRYLEQEYKDRLELV